MARRNPAGAYAARVGNYMADVDPQGIDPEMKSTLGIGQKVTPLSKEEKAFAKDRESRGKNPGPAIQRARKANKKPPATGY